MAKYRGYFFLLFKWRLVRLAKKPGMSFSQNVRIGYSLKLVRTIGIMVNVTAVIGNGVTLHQLTSIGSDNDESAIIGDDVYIGPNVCLVENVRIGSFLKIGAGAVVVSDIPPGFTTVGVPAKVK